MAQASSKDKKKEAGSPLQDVTAPEAAAEQTKKAASAKRTGAAKKTAEPKAGAGTKPRGGTAKKASSSEKKPASKSAGTRSATKSADAKTVGVTAPEKTATKAAKGKSGTTTAAKAKREAAQAAEKAPKATTRKSPAAAAPKAKKAPAKKPAVKQEEKQDPKLLPLPTDSGKKQKETPAGDSLPATTKGSSVTPSTVPIRFPAEDKKKIAGRIATVLALLVLVGVAVLIFFFRPTSYTERTHSVAFLYQADRDVTVIAVDGKVRGEVSGQVQEKSYDDTGRVCAARIGDKLYLIKGRDITEVDGDTLDFVLSTDGAVLAYRTAEHKLYYMQIGQKDGTSLLSSAAIYPEYALSPDGRELFYAFEQEGSRQVDIYSESGEKPHLADTQGLFPVAISNRCEYVYYTNGEGELYLMFEGKRVLCGETPQLETLVFNRDFSEMLFYDGSEMKLFADGERLLIPDLASTERLELQANHRVAVRELTSGRQYLMRTLLKNYYLHYRGSGVMLVFLKKDGSMQDVSYVDGADTVTVTDKSVFFLLTDVGESTSKTHLYRCKTGKAECERLLYNVSEFCPNVDGSRILYTDAHGALYSLRVGDETPVRLCDSVQADTLCVTSDDTFYFHRAEDGALCTSDNGGEYRVVCESADAVWTDGYTAYYVEQKDDGTYLVFANYRNQRRWQQLGERVSSIN